MSHSLAFLDSIEIQTGSLYLFLNIMKFHQIIYRYYQFGISKKGSLPVVFRGQILGGATQINTQRLRNM